MGYCSAGRYAGRKEWLTPELVRKVQANDKEAILELLDIFEDKIRRLSVVELYDRWGNPVFVRSKEYTSELEDALVRAFKRLGVPKVHTKRKGGKGKWKKGKECRDCMEREKTLR